MRRAVFTLIALAGCWSLPAQTAAVPPPNDPPMLTMIRQAIAASGFKGELVVRTAGEPGARAIQNGVAIQTLDGIDDQAAQRRWPWESTTKQVLATMVMQAVDRGELMLDAPIASYLPLPASGDLPLPTVRQVLQHRSGLRNSDDSPQGGDGVPDFYTTGATGLDWCLTDRRTPSQSEWRYNNCDYIVMATVLERATGKQMTTLFRDRIAVPAAMSDATALLIDGDAFYGRDPGYARMLPRFGWAGGMAGPIADLIAFDQALEDGRLLSEAARAEMWRGDPQLGYMALGQWAFEAKLNGCDTPVRIVERRGGIGKYQTRNIILPDLHREIVVMTDDGEFEFGEIWQGKGFSYDVLSAAACTS